MDIMLELDLNPRHIRVKTFAADKEEGKVKLGKGSRDTTKVQSVISYTIKLRKDTKELAEAVVQRLKQTFSDKTKRRTFLENFWDRVGAKGRLHPPPKATPKAKMRRMIKRVTSKDRMRQVIQEASGRMNRGWDSYTPHSPTELQMGRSHVVSAKSDTKDDSPEYMSLGKQDQERDPFDENPFQPDKSLLTPTEGESEDDEVHPDEAMSLTAELDGIVSNSPTDLSATVQRASQANARQQQMRNHLERFRARRFNNRRSSFGARVLRTKKSPGLDEST